MPVVPIMRPLDAAAVEAGHNQRVLVDYFYKSGTYDEE
jgi:hypothetical protein